MQVVQQVLSATPEQGFHKGW